MAVSREMSITIEGSLKNFSTTCSLSGRVVTNGIIVLTVSNITGSRAVKKLLREPGSCASGMVRG
jgi:hypothetical protein